MRRVKALVSFTRPRYSGGGATARNQKHHIDRAADNPSQVHQFLAAARTTAKKVQLTVDMPRPDVPMRKYAPSPMVAMQHVMAAIDAVVLGYLRWIMCAVDQAPADVKITLTEYEEEAGAGSAAETPHQPVPAIAEGGRA